MGTVQRIRTNLPYQNNLYTFIMSMKDSQEMIKIQCPVVTSYSDHMYLKVPILSGIQTSRIDLRSNPIIDSCDPLDRQIAHKFLVLQNNVWSHFCVKVYPFANYDDNLFKNGIYQANIYRKLQTFSRSQYILADFFVLQKGNLKSMVFVYHSYLCTLQDVILYRREHNNLYTKQQQIYICMQILQKYYKLSQNGITHRDLRPSKIWLSEPKNIHINTNTNRNAFTLGYQLANLQSARSLTQQQTLRAQTINTGLLMTVRGIPAYSQNNVADLQIQNQQIGIYHPFSNDRVQLARTLAVVVSLNLQNPADYTFVRKSNKIVYNLIKDLQNMKIPLQSIIRKFSTYSNSTSTAILQSDSIICKNQIHSFLKPKYQQKSNKATFDLLLNLHQRDLLQDRLKSQLIQNQQNNRQSDNIKLLHRMGEYYQGIGVSNNDYYDEELRMLLQMAQGNRNRFYQTDQIITQAESVNADKFRGHSKYLLDILVEKSYNCVLKGQLDQAQFYINSAMNEGAGKPNIPIQTQMKILQAKGEIQSLTNGPIAGDSYLLKGLQLSQNRNNFVTQNQMLEQRSNFQSLLAGNIINKLTNNRSNNYIEEMAKCDDLLQSAKNTKVNIALQNPNSLAKVYERIGDLAQLRQNHVAAAEAYEKAIQIYSVSVPEIASSERLRILNKLYAHYQQHSENVSDQTKVKLAIEQIKRGEQMPPVDSRSYFQKARHLKQKNRGKIFTNNNNKQNEMAQIREDEQQLYNSKRVSYSGTNIA